MSKKQETNIIYDIVIIGAGPAGMTAAIYAARANKTVALIDKDGFGGNIAKSPHIENIPGFPSISGVDFAEKLYTQISSYTQINHIIEEVVLLKYNHGLILVSLANRDIICCRSLIIATGTEHKTLNLNTKNIYTCVTCDGPFYKNKPVIVVGSGNTGATYALELATYCKKVYLCDITKTMLCEQVLQDKILNNNKIEWLPATTIKNVKNDKDNNLSTVELSTSKSIKVNAIFAAIGMIPKTKVFQNFVTLDAADFIIADDACKTALIPGVFVAGDCRTKTVRQVTTATADGTTAAINAIKFIDGGK